MNKIKKLAASLTAFSVAAAIASCGAPTIGSGSANAVTIDGYEIKAGIFIFYTMQSYNDAKTQLAEEMDATPSLSEVEDAEIDGVDSTKWIQDKATQYCSDFVAIEREFEKIGGELSEEDLEEIDSSVEKVMSNDSQYNYTENGISEESLRDIATISYKSNYIFNYYYGTEGEKGISEDELKDYFDNNFARVKYVSMSYLDSEGNKLDESGKKKIRDMANEYADRVNKKSSAQEKLFEMNEVIDDYNDYVAEQTAESTEGDAEAAVTTTTTSEDNSTETTTTTTTDAHANERLIQKPVTTTASNDNAEQPAVTTTQSASSKSSEKLNNYVFNDLTDYDKAVVFDDEENDSIYVIIRSDLKERLNEDDLWTEDNIEYLQSLRFNDEFIEYMKKISDAYTVERNDSAYKRYEPFDDIVLE